MQIHASAALFGAAKRRKGVSRAAVAGRSRSITTNY